MHPHRKLRVLFVCRGNACRSQMAEAYARTHGSDVLEPASAGLRPARRISQTTRRLFRERNIRMDGQFSKGLSEVGLQRMDLVVNLCALELPAGLRSARRHWPVQDPIRKEEAVHRQVAAQVEALVLDLVHEVRRLKSHWPNTLQ